MTRLLLVDNFDSFTFNLHHLFGQLNDVEVTVRRNNEPFIAELADGRYDALLISPGPGSPDDQAYFGNCMSAIQQFGPQGFPILGVCLGFQGIALAYGAKLKRAVYPMHGKTTRLHILHDQGVLQGIPDDTPVMRYHSIMIDPEQPFPSELIVTAETTTGEPSIAKNGREIMAIQHQTDNVYGVQFHPESFGTECGIDLARRFIDITRTR
ncbi:anthranilate synthase component II [Roseimaritima ulvae]|uniref:Aminodeoxychorismate/anthranilate synthase component 2 n=1 Tax=Roseimaritima ulvae TaxID=980254 RepID=A0A5B9R7H1_9BACT|nr:aminodeoxychorismate/anthranilate synthase component II [Roseimaritima ulvae]QEG42393.1 Aminodeoxychorismate/anthranilate synthase component 2 [Roseimaritima ulvae]